MAGDENCLPGFHNQSFFCLVLVLQATGYLVPQTVKR